MRKIKFFNVVIFCVILVSYFSEKKSIFAEEKPLNLTVNDVVILALQNSRDLKNSYLQRIIDRQNLAIAEDKFNPNFLPEIAIGYNLNDTGSNTINTGEISVGSSVNLKIPTGADLSLNWRGKAETLDNEQLSQNISINFSQPLLRNAGREVNLASIKDAQFTEEQNILSLINNINSTITNAILAYLNLFQAQEQVKIQKLSLNRAVRQLEVTQALIEAGRRAKVDLVENQTSVANREVDLLIAENNLDAARLGLIQVLDINKKLALIAVEIPETKNLLASFNLNNLLELALKNNPNYLTANIAIKRGNLDVLLARNERKWDLNLDVNYDFTTSNMAENNNDLRTGLIFKRQFGDLSVEQQEAKSQVNLTILNNNLTEEKENLEIEISNNLRDINNTFQGLQQAKKARELSELQLENEREKLKLGVPGTRQIDLLNLEDSLVEAQNRELNANIDYFSSLIKLDQTIGNTWKKWGVKIDN